MNWVRRVCILFVQCVILFFGIGNIDCATEVRKLTPLRNTISVRNSVPISEFIGSALSENKPGFAIVIDNVLTRDECNQWIVDTESVGYEPATINIGGKQRLVVEARNSSRCTVDDSATASQIWERIQPFIPQDFSSTHVAYELNEKLRFLRYSEGEYFAPHSDGSFSKPNGDISLLTMQLYLNDDFKGGTTRFYDESEELYYDVEPRVGSALIFEHPMLHSGEPLKKGRKYAVRSDIMFRIRTSGEL